MRRNGWRSYVGLCTVVYLCLNPVRAGIVDDFRKYRWSSIGEYYKGIQSNIVDNQFVEGLFSNIEELNQFTISMSGKKLDIRRSKIGKILGGTSFIEEALSRYNRTLSLKPNEMSKFDEGFEYANKVIWEFEQKIGIGIDDINISTIHGKKLRGELLRYLKDRSGLKYSEIIKLPLFSNLKLGSLPKLYRDAKHRLDIK